MATATYEPIATTTLGSAAASITFSSIAATWTDLRIVFTGISIGGGTMRCQINGDTGSNYSETYLFGDGASATSGRYTSRTDIVATTAAVSTTIPAFVTLDIFSYTGSTYKTLLITASEDQNGSGKVERIVALWRSTSAVTSVSLYQLGDTWNPGTTATLYGIKCA